MIAPSDAVSLPVKLEELYATMLKPSVHVHQSAQWWVLLDGEVVLDSTWASDSNNEGVWVTQLLHGSRRRGVITMNAELIVVASWGARVVVAVERGLSGVEGPALQVFDGNSDRHDGCCCRSKHERVSVELVICLSCLFVWLPWKRPSKEGATEREGTMA
jgi:hypothetical protein